MVDALRTHRVNTLAELRRIERVLAAIGTDDVTEPMTTAWSYYVNSHGLLTELRSLTRNYPFKYVRLLLICMPNQRANVSQF
jgi:hypothetical protein